MAKVDPQSGMQLDSGAFTAMMAPFDIGSVSKVNASAWTTMLDSNAKLLEAGGAMNAEVVDFVGRRLERDAAIGECLIDCRSLDEAYEVYTDFIQTSVADYFSELQRLMAIGESALSSSAKTLQHAEVEAPAPTSAKAKPAAA